MKRIKRYLKIILGSFLIAVTLNLFFKDFNFMPSGIFGIATAYTYKTHVNLAISMLLLNFIFIGLSMVLFGDKYLSKSSITFWLIPLFIYITKDIGIFLNIMDTDKMLIAIYGGVLMGFGSSLIYHEDIFVSGGDVLVLMDRLILRRSRPLIIYIIDLFMLIFTYKYFGMSTVLYSIISIIIMEFMSRRVMIGINDSKVFYIITKEEKLVKKYILEELRCDITEFEVKGGFSKNKNKILMTVIPTDDYYKLREGIKEIDPNAFISITESYEVVNGNVTINS